MGDELVTEKDCPGAGVMEQERHFLTILRQNHAFLAGVSEEALLLIHDDGALLFTSGR
jgi:heat shock protein HslJ